MRKIIFYLSLLVFCIAANMLHAQKNKGLALTPPMGWNTWNTFECEVNETLIRETADAMVASGMKEVGYTYIIIDDCWQGGRDETGKIYCDSLKFPSGMRALADYIHSKGLKLGIYSDAGDLTCAGYAGSRGHEYQDALTYAQWEIDYLKYDWCNTDSLNAFWAYTTMRDALYASGRPIVFSICEWGNNSPWLWAKDIGHLWRISGDIAPCFDCEVKHDGWSAWGVLKIAHQRENIRSYSGPDHWNDFDMMEVGNGMTLSEDRTHFALWCMLASPLIAGNDIRKMSTQTQEILTNKEAIAINQDSLGIQAFRYLFKDSVEIWAKPLVKGNWAICFLNRSTGTKQLDFDWTEHIIEDDVFNMHCNARKNTFQIDDIYSGKNIGNSNKNLQSSLASHDVLFLKLSPDK